MNQWVDAEAARSCVERGRGRGVRVAILDSGVELSHPAMSGLTLSDDLVIVDDGLQLQVMPGEGRDLYGHGTAVAHIIHKLAPEAEIGSFRVLGDHLDSRTKIIQEGVRQALDLNYRILNCSFGCGVLNHVLEYKSWVDEAYLKGVHIIAACNNEDYTVPEWPGYFPSVITVNMARSEALDRFFYKPGHLVEFAAKGVNVEVPWLALCGRPIGPIAVGAFAFATVTGQGGSPCDCAALERGRGGMERRVLKHENNTGR
jgi:hypothetical protein